MRWFYTEFRARGERRQFAVHGVLVSLLALAMAGCGLSIPVGPFSAEDELPTGSIAPAAKVQVSLVFKDLTDEDWRRAKSALAVALDPQGNGSSAGWDNPESGIKGTFSPVGGPFVKDDQVCRAFLASAVMNSGQQWVQGSACRPSGGEWAVRDVRPWKKPA